MENHRASPGTHDLPYVAGLSREGDRSILGWSVGVAVLAHVAVLFVHLPKAEIEFEEPDRPRLEVIKILPPPPPIERPRVERTTFDRRVPIPDPTPDAPEPVREAAPLVEPAPFPSDLVYVIGDPEPPPPSRPLIPGVGDVTNPVLIESTRVEPLYPESARVARVPGTVILRAVITREGTVEEVEVLSVDRPGLGFEAAAIEAVRQWQYRPAMRNGRPVDVYFTIHVRFTLR